MKGGSRSREKLFAFVLQKKGSVSEKGENGGGDLWSKRVALRDLKTVNCAPPSVLNKTGRTEVARNRRRGFGGVTLGKGGLLAGDGRRDFKKGSFGGYLVMQFKQISSIENNCGGGGGGVRGEVRAEKRP